MPKTCALLEARQQTSTPGIKGASIPGFVADRAQFRAIIDIEADLSPAAFAAGRLARGFHAVAESAGVMPDQ